MFDNWWAFVVEDDAHSLVAIGEILRDLGIQFKRNTSGLDVPAKVSLMQPRPNFILLDMTLPQGDPFAIVRALKSQAALSKIPVIAIADYADGNLVSQARQAGFAGLVAKPLPRRQFGDVVRRVLAGEPVWQVPA